MLSITFPHVDYWNVWWSDYGNTPAGFAELKVERSTTGPWSTVATLAASRRPVLCSSNFPVAVGRQMGGYGGVTCRAGAAALLQKSPSSSAAFATAGAAHVQLVVDPITRDSIEWFERDVRRTRRLVLLFYAAASWSKNRSSRASASSNEAAANSTSWNVEIS